MYASFTVEKEDKTAAKHTRHKGDERSTEKNANGSQTN